MRLSDYAMRCRSSTGVRIFARAGSTTFAFGQSDLRRSSSVEDGSTSAHLMWCETSSVADYSAAQADHAEEHPQPACILGHSVIHRRAQRRWLLCAAGTHAEGAAIGLR